MLVKAQALIYLLEKGIHPKIAIKTCDLWGDPEKVYVQSKEYLDALYKTAEEKQKEYENEREYLRDTCLSAQDDFKKLLSLFEE